MAQPSITETHNPVSIFDEHHPPPPELLAHERVLLTPHTSAMSDHASGRSRAIFRDNLLRCLRGEPLLNQVDWERGY